MCDLCDCILSAKLTPCVFGGCYNYKGSLERVHLGNQFHEKDKLYGKHMGTWHGKFTCSSVESERNKENNSIK